MNYEFIFNIQNLEYYAFEHTHFEHMGPSDLFWRQASLQRVSKTFRVRFPSRPRALCVEFRLCSPSACVNLFCLSCRSLDQVSYETKNFSSWTSYWTKRQTENLKVKHWGKYKQTLTYMTMSRTEWTNADSFLYSHLEDIFTTPHYSLQTLNKTSIFVKAYGMQT